MFKRLFFFSGLIALGITCAVMWFWYLPMKEAERANAKAEEVSSDTLTKDSLNVEMPTSK